MLTRSHPWRLLVLAVALTCGSAPALAEDLDELNERIAQLTRKGQLKEAIALAERAVKLTEDSWWTGDADTAAALDRLGGLYAKAGESARAQVPLRRALNLRAEDQGLRHADTLKTFRQLMAVCRAHGSCEALRSDQAFSRLARQHEEPAHKGQGAPSANAHEDQSGQDTALASWQAAERAAPAPGRDAERAGYFQELESEALPIAEQQVKDSRKRRGPQHPETLGLMTNLAMLYDDYGHYAKSEPLHKEVLSITERIQGPLHAETASALISLGIHYRHTGAARQAEPLLVRAAAVAEQSQGVAHSGTARALHELGMLYLVLGEQAKAELPLRRALEIHAQVFGEKHPFTLESLTGLARLYTATGSHAKAEPLLQQLLVVHERAHPMQLAGTLNDLGQLYFVTGRPAQAEPLLQRALGLMEGFFGPEHPEVATLTDNVAALHWWRGDLPRARELHLRAQRVRETQLVQLLLVGSEERRRQYLSLQTVHPYVTFSLADDSPGGRSLGATAALQLKGRILDASADTVARLRKRLNGPGQALFEQLRQVARARSELALNSFPAPADFRRRLADLEREQERLEGELARRSSAGIQDAQPVTLQRVQQALGGRDVLVEWIRFLPLDTARQPGGMRSGAARYAAYLITRDQPPAVVDLGPADAIEQVAQQLQARLRRSDADPKSAEARELHRLVMQPLLAPLARLQPQPGQLLLSPDGALNLVPLAALVDGDNRYLGERHALSYLSSGRDLLKLQDPAAPRSGMAVWAAPDYDHQGPSPAPAARPFIGAAGPQSSSAGPVPAQRAADLDRSGRAFLSLPGTAAEARLLQKLFNLPDPQVATGPAATEARLKHLAGPGILHIATHGFFLPDLPQVGTPTRSEAKAPGGAAAAKRGVESDDTAPLKRRQGLGENPLLRSGLALAGANPRRSEGGEDGILTAAEAAQLDLQGTQLVVLSACETGTGDVANGEGVYGLRRALVLAGAQSQLVSLWKVDDKATEQLMGEYYRRLQKGEGRAEALRSAQAVIRSNPATAHPFYWAPFVGVGDWRPVTMVSAQVAANGAAGR